MKLKILFLTLAASSISLLSGQTATPEKPAAEKAEKEVKPEGPYEECAFRIFDLVSSFPDVITSIKDGPSADAAKKKLDGIMKKLEGHTEELKKMDVPSNEARKKLKAKMEGKQKAMEKKMQGVMTAMAGLDPEVGQKAGEMLMGFGQKMQALGPTMEKYFEPDEDQKGGEKGQKK